MKLQLRLLAAGFILGAWFVLGGATCENDLGLEKGNMSGRVVRVADGTPVVGAVVSIGSESSTTDSGGRFRIMRVNAGTRYLRVQAPGLMLPGGQIVVTVTDGDHDLGDIGLVPASEAPPAQPTL